MKKVVALIALVVGVGSLTGCKEFDIETKTITVTVPNLQNGKPTLAEEQAKEALEKAKAEKE